MGRRMKDSFRVATVVGLVVFLSGCATPPPGAERGPQGTIAYEVLVETTPPGAKIVANGHDAGESPIRLKFYGDLNGKFHYFGYPYYTVKALPTGTNQYPQIRFFRAGRELIPPRIDFDMSQPGPTLVPVLPPAPAYVYPYGPPVYYYPGYYYAPYGYR
jgi:hypothetical protein